MLHKVSHFQYPAVTPHIRLSERIRYYNKFYRGIKSQVRLTIDSWSLFGF